MGDALGVGVGHGPHQLLEPTDGLGCRDGSVLTEILAQGNPLHVLEYQIRNAPIQSSLIQGEDIGMPQFGQILRLRWNLTILARPVQEFDGNWTGEVSVPSEVHGALQALAKPSIEPKPPNLHRRGIHCFPKNLGLP